MDRFDGSELKRWRRRWGKSQTELGGVLGVSRATVVRWETSEEDVPVMVRLALAAIAMGAPPIGVLGREVWK